MGRETETERLRHRVRAALGDDELIDESQVDVGVAIGVVALVGAVGHGPGISQLRNELSIEAQRRPSPER